MATIAKHIQIARTEGPEAGLAAYLNVKSGVSALHPAFKEIQKKRTPATRLATYCTLFADKLNAPVKAITTPVIDETTTTDEDDENTLTAIIAKAVAAAVAEVTGQPVIKEAKAVKVAKVVGLTCGEAWKRLGSDPEVKPTRDHSELASNRQLYTLNEKGLLRFTA